MLSLRTLIRSAPRAARGLPAARATLLQAMSPASRLRLPCASAFSSGSPRMRNRSPASESDGELVEKLTSEIKMEKALNEEEEVPTSVKDYLENGPFQILDTPGQEEVILTRNFGDEKIRVSFSIADINNYDPENDEFQDPAQADEDDMDASKGQEGSDETDEQDEPQTLPVRISIIVQKNKSALAIETVAEGGMIAIDNVYYYADASHALAKTPEAAHQRLEMYLGPPFSNLDEDLQVLLERYLDERGINQALALFVPDYIDMKEQKEYLQWLQNVKGFLAQ